MGICSLHFYFFFIFFLIHMFFKSRYYKFYFTFLFQRIRELEDKIELQKRQLKEIEEKVKKCLGNAKVTSSFPSVIYFSQLC